ncbi:MAG: phenylacetate--CoA ligase family protein [Anaerolineae bacterium]
MTAETMSFAEQEKVRGQRLAHIVRHAYENAPGVRAKLEEAGITPDQIKSLADLKKIPVTSKDELVELQKANPPFGGYLAVPLSDLKRIYFSPGPIYDPQGEEEARATAEAIGAAGFGSGDIVLNTFSYHLVPAGLMIDEALQAVGCTVVPTGVGNTELQVKMMADLRATGYVGTPSFLMTLIKKAEEMGLDFRKVFALRKALFTAEPYPPSLRKQFEEGYGLETAQAYGTADVGLVAYECPEASGLHFSDEVILEIVDPASGKRLGPGEAGEVVVTTFNETYPLIRFGTGDLSAYTAEPCPCGRTSPRLIAIMGRVGDAVKVRGMFVHPNQLRAAVSRFPEVTAFQAVITRPEHRDQMTLRLEVTEGTDQEKLQEGLGKAVRDLCRLGADRIEFVAKGTIPEDAKPMVDERTWE